MINTQIRDEIVKKLSMTAEEVEKALKIYKIIPLFDMDQTIKDYHKEL